MLVVDVSDMRDEERLRECVTRACEDTRQQLGEPTGGRSIYMMLIRHDGMQVVEYTGGGRCVWHPLLELIR